MHRSFTISDQIFAQRFFFLSSQQSRFQVLAMKPSVGTGADPGFNAITMNQQNPNYRPFWKHLEVDEVSPKVEAVVVARLRCLEP
jgi:hypothetical protein